MPRPNLSIAIAALLLAPPALLADTVFVDDFENGVSPLWGNELGAWAAPDGVYSAEMPNNRPSARSSLPFEVSNFTIDLDINGVDDGGIWLRSASAPGTQVGVKGVLLVAKGTSLYWHVVPTGDGYGGILNPVNGVFAAGSSPHIRVEVCGNTYDAFVNGSTTPATTLTNGDFPVGRVALYDFSTQTFDNVLFIGIDVGDLNGDGSVNGADLGIMLAAWGPCGTSGPCIADLTCDGIVDGADLGILLGNWDA